MHTGGVLKKEGKKETAFFLQESIRGFYCWLGITRDPPTTPLSSRWGGFGLPLF